MQAILIYILLFAVLGFLISKSTISKNTKIILVSFLCAVIIFAIFYENKKSSTEEKNRQIANFFRDGKEIVCDGQKIDSKNFRFDGGTMSFVSNQKIGVIYKIENCETK